MALHRFSLELFVPRSAEGAAQLIEQLGDMAAFGPGLISLSGFVPAADAAEALAAAVRAHGLRLQLHLASDVSRAHAAAVVAACHRIGACDLLLMPALGERPPPPPGELSEHDAGSFGSGLELLRFVSGLLARHRGHTVRVGVLGYPRGSAGEAADYAADLEQLRLLLREGASCIVCQPVFEATAVAALIADLGHDARGVTLQPTLLPMGRGLGRLCRLLRVSPPLELLNDLAAAQTEAAMEQVGQAAYASLARQMRALVAPPGGEIMLHLAALNDARCAALAGFAPLVHRTAGPAISLVR